MGFESFYGGRRGASFVIAKNYVDIIAMVTDFAKGNSFSQVKYDEYVLINTINKNHPDNGKLFKRGYDYNSSRTIEGYESLNNDGEVIINGTEQEYINATINFNSSIIAGGAIYIGSIAGPAGGTPFVTMAPYEDIDGIGMSSSVPLDKIQYGSGTIGNKQDLVPGKNENVYNDNILWKSVSIMNPNEDRGQAYIGFKIPYLVTDFVKKDITPYENVSVTRLDDKTHPFYQQWELAIPPGKHGNEIERLNKLSLNFLNDPQIEEQEDSFISVYEDPTFENPMTRDDYTRLGLTGDDDILVYTYKDYTNAETIQKICYLAKYKQIEDVQITDEGVLLINYSNGVQENFGEIVSTVSDISYNKNGSGLLEIAFNTGQSVSVPIIYPTNLILDEETGNLSFKNNNEEDDTNTHILGTLKWIDHIGYEDSNKQLVIFYNTRTEQGYLEEERLSIPFVSDLEIEENGNVNIKKGDGPWESINRVLKWIDHTEYSSEENTLRIFYNNDSEDSPSETIQNVFHKVEEIRFQDSIETEPGVFSEPEFIVTYSDGAEEEIPFTTGNLIKSIQLLPGSDYDEVDQGQILNSRLRITYTNNQTQIIELDGKLISNMYFSDGQVEKTIEEEDGQEETSFTVPTSTLVVNYDNNTSDTFKNFVFPKTVKILDDTINSSHSIVIYDSQGEQMDRSKPLTGIERVRVYNNRLLVLYNNPTARQNIPEERRVSILEEDGSTALVWDDLGVVRADAGILAGKNFTINEIKENEQDEVTNDYIIDFLNTEYEDGTLLNGLYRIVTVGEENENKKFFGYDISTLSWYYLGTIPNSSSSQIDAVYGTKEEFESSSDIKKSSLRVGGMFFIITGEDD